MRVVKIAPYVKLGLSVTLQLQKHAYHALQVKIMNLKYHFILSKSNIRNIVCIYYVQKKYVVRINCMSKCELVKN